ncbi:hypothetical protein INT45_000414 [Circinella minor]|uniref:Reverse transcriptase/retrotransposon-derived protein RNase H-like domain-containing protein n=1 Tax=Circinella minor TaxID=1195481 RepID=A0A8H7RRS7_9FUNG|nr:hypothetical protein INT45_000414 [Circinella minor]
MTRPTHPSSSSYFKIKLLSKVKFLGFLVGSAGIRPDPKKVEVIRNWPVLKTVRDVQKFLGFCAFYHCFLVHLSSTAHPLHRLLHKDTKFIWDSSRQLAFDKLCQAIMKLPTLAFPDPDLPYDLHTDASTFALGAVLVQNGHPVAFASCSLTAPEKNYNTTEQECLAIV